MSTMRSRKRSASTMRQTTIKRAITRQIHETNEVSKGNRFTESIMTVASNLQSNYDKADTESWEKKAKQDEDSWTLGGQS